MTCKNCKYGEKSLKIKNGYYCINFDTMETEVKENHRCTHYEKREEDEGKVYDKTSTGDQKK